MKLSHKLTGLIIFLFYLLINLIILPDYGLSWDYHNHYYAGLYHLGLPLPAENTKIPFSDPDPRLTVNDPFGPFTQIIPALSQTIFYNNWNLLPMDVSYNLPMVFFGSLGLLILYFFLLEIFGFLEAVIGTISLGLMPPYFAYLHNNMKDIPNAVMFALAVYLFYRFTRNSSRLSLALALVAAAIAFNFKINSVFVPVVCFLYYLTFGNKNNRHIFKYFLLVVPATLLLWWPFWQDPLAKLLQMPSFYSGNTLGMSVLLNGNFYQSGFNIPIYYPYWYLLISTPPPIIILSLIGVFVCTRNILKGKREFSLFIFWFFVPLIRYLSPTAAAIDGVRHFMEVLFPLGSFAAIGGAAVYRIMTKKIRQKYPVTILFLSAAFYSVLILIVFHPYQASYFNFLTAGISGAQDKYDIDFWGTPQKEAVLWLNGIAPRGSFIHVVMAQSTAATYLREDLLENLNKRSINDSDYTVLLNRRSFFPFYNVESFKNEKIQKEKVLFSVTRYAVPLVWVFAK
ncbi:MAG: hypothetical protein UV73_C0001G0240 [Candidatus Gottesmanbacteria bacterium GW2011_GWA2_43_14]|uniref:Glycosyltransferase RgtA/B/C/D-like domain-containing protein n=1 Tax=Candidatus Gottesmanbacteria bacterium GW2011_GWA2_43_14 TaxID=1618443 RepID=A0A0G1DM63_9BACT|nr:MAG: hypothetical protein UV73_C0001G0240 [Candidatus Gottesmanbacteria bacterium GW2011_GWA2_43_14]